MASKRDQGSCTYICLVGKFIVHFYDKRTFYDEPHLLNDLWFYAKPHGIMVMVLGLLKKIYDQIYYYSCQKSYNSAILFNYLHYKKFRFKVLSPPVGIEKKKEKKKEKG